MANITALLIVVTLTGQPVASALCSMWCGQQSDMESCDDAVAASTSTSATSATCREFLTTGPFLTEEGRSTMQKATPGTVAPAAPLPRAAVAARTGRHAGRDATAGRPHPTLVLRV